MRSVKQFAKSLAIWASGGVSEFVEMPGYNIVDVWTNEFAERIGLFTKYRDEEIEELRESLYQERLKSGHENYFRQKAEQAEETEVDYIKKLNDKIMDLDEKFKREITLAMLLVKKLVIANEEILRLKEKCGEDKPKQGAF